MTNVVVTFSGAIQQHWPVSIDTPPQRLHAVAIRMHRKFEDSLLLAPQVAIAWDESW